MTFLGLKLHLSLTPCDSYMRWLLSHVCSCHLRWIAHFRITFGLFFKASPDAHLFMWKLVLIHMQMKTNFQIKKWAPGLALKKRLRIFIVFAWSLLPILDIPVVTWLEVSLKILKILEYLHLSISKLSLTGNHCSLSVRNVMGCTKITKIITNLQMLVKYCLSI